MKIKQDLFFTTVLATFILVQFSCSSTKRSAVRCPHFSHNRNISTGHNRHRTDYPDLQNRNSSALSWFDQGRNKGTAGTPVHESRRNTLPARNGTGYALSCIQPVRVQLAAMNVPVEKKHQVKPAEWKTPQAASGIDKPSESGCDTIVLKNGDLVEARVSEIGQQEIRYKKCDDIDGPTLVIGISEVFMIKYPNGTRDYFNFEKDSASGETGTVKKKADGMAIAGFISSLAGLFIAGIPLGIMSVVFGFISMGKMNRHPERYKGRGFAIAGIIIGIVDIIGAFIAIAYM